MNLANYINPKFIENPSAVVLFMWDERFDIPQGMWRGYRSGNHGIYIKRLSEQEFLMILDGFPFEEQIEIGSLLEKKSKKEEDNPRNI